MSTTKAFVDTTVLTDALLKPQTEKSRSALAAISRYDQTLLPVYAIKEWKHGPLSTFAYVHDKLVVTRSWHKTAEALSSLWGYKKSTAMEALTAAGAPRLGPRRDPVGSDYDEQLADRFRLSLQSLIIRSWRKRRKLTTEVIQDLACYSETTPTLGREGLFDMEPKKCHKETDCSLASELKARPELLRALRDAIPETSIRAEDRRRRKALKRLINRPGDRLDRDSCRDLGDAIFAFFCPEDAVILTTNIRDHQPLAEAVGKTAVSPKSP